MPEEVLALTNTTVVDYVGDSLVEQLEIISVSYLRGNCRLRQVDDGRDMVQFA